MNKKAAFNLQGMIIGTLTASLFVSIMLLVIASFSNNYDVTGYDSDELGRFNHMDNLSAEIDQVREEVDKVTVDPSAFDLLANLYNKIISPFKFVYRSIELLLGGVSDLIDVLGLWSVFGDYLISVLIVLVVIGIVMIKFYMGREK